MKKSPPTLILLYVLLGYVVTQFLWWGYLLYELNAEVLSLTVPALEDGSGRDLNQKLFMILGEGTVFFTLLIIGAFYIRKFLLSEQGLARQERNFLLATTHEFNSPIAAIKLNLQTLKRVGITSEQQMLMTESGLTNLNRLESLVSNILMASRIDAGKIQMYSEEVDLGEVVTSVLKRYEGLIKAAEIEVYLDLKSQTKLSLDKNAMEMVLANLIENAIKYASKSKLYLISREESKYVELVVADTGIGVSPDRLKQIFQKFYREQNEETRSQKGTGLGLFLVHELIRLHGGRVFAQVNDPQGLKVIINIPKN